MKRCTAALALLLVAACSTPDRRLEETARSVTLAIQQGDLATADELARHGMALGQERSDARWEATFRLLRAEALVSRRDLDGAQPLIDAPIPAGRGAEDLRARQAYVAALAALARGRLPDALTKLDDALRAGDPPAGLRMEMQALRGQVLTQLGRSSEAEPALIDLVDDADRTNDPYHEALAANVLGMGRLVQNRYDEALQWFERVLALRGLTDTTVYASTLSNAGVCYARLGDFDRAVEVQQRAVDIHRRHNAARQLENALGGLGNSYVLEGEAETGLAYLRQAQQVASDAHLYGDAALWGGNLAAAYVDLGKWDEAERFNQDAARFKEASHTGKTVYNVLNAAQIAGGRHQTDEANRLYQSALSDPNAGPDVRWTAYSGLAGVAIATKQPASAARYFEAALETIEKTRSDLLKTDYKLSFLTRLIDFYRAYVDALVDEGRIDRALEIADSSRGRVLAEREDTPPPARVGVDAFRALGRNSRRVLLSYWLAPGRSHLWVVTGDATREFPLPGSADIQKLVRAERDAIEGAVADTLAPESPGDRLFKLLVSPALPWVPPGSSVVIVADGALHELNFETLPVGGPRRHYWIEDVEIEMAPSLGMLTRAPAAAPADRSLLLIGNPTPRPPEFPALSYAPTEISRVRRSFAVDRVAVYEGPNAGPAAYGRAEPGRFAVIHFTAHATSNVDSPLESAVILSGPDGAYKLYARDVARLPIRAELVTVSACRSAGGRAYSGEGLVGFAWAFLRAGARRVVAGLWDVDDESTAELMGVMYERIAKGDPPARALRAAKLSLLAAGGRPAKPYSWAPFELFTLAI